VPDGETRSYGRAVRPPMGTARRLLVSRRRGSLRARCTRQRHAPPLEHGHELAELVTTH